MNNGRTACCLLVAAATVGTALPPSFTVTFSLSVIGVVYDGWVKPVHGLPHWMCWKMRIDLSVAQTHPGNDSRELNYITIWTRPLKNLEKAKVNEYSFKLAILSSPLSLIIEPVDSCSTTPAPPLPWLLMSNIASAVLVWLWPPFFLPSLLSRPPQPIQPPHELTHNINWAIKRLIKNSSWHEHRASGALDALSLL